jgi:SdpC family antimicrobial peptide
MTTNALSGPCFGRRLTSIALACCLFALPLTPAVAQSTGSQPTTFTGEDLYGGLVLWQGPVADLVPEIRQLKELVPELESPKDAETQEALSSFEDRLITQLAVHDPNFFPDFQREMTSGNPLRVQRALHRAGTETIEVMSSEIPELKGALDALLAPNVEGGVASKASELLDTKISTPDVDRMLRELAQGSGYAQFVGDCLVLNLVVVINGAVYLNIVGVQNLGLAIAVVRYLAVTYDVDTPLPKLLNLPVAGPGNGSLAFGKRLNAGRLAAEQMVSRIARQFAHS